MKQLDLIAMKHSHSWTNLIEIPIGTILDNLLEKKWMLYNSKMQFTLSKSDIETIIFGLIRELPIMKCIVSEKTIDNTTEKHVRGCEEALIAILLYLNNVTPSSEPILNTEIIDIIANNNLKNTNKLTKANFEWLMGDETLDITYAQLNNKSQKAFNDVKIPVQFYTIDNNDFNTNTLANKVLDICLNLK